MQRLHRLQKTAAMRALVADVHLDPQRLVLPLFVHEDDTPADIPGLPGHQRLPVAQLAGRAKEAVSAGLRAVLLFGVPSSKSVDAVHAAAPDGITQRGLRALKEALGDDLVVMADCCLCSFTTDGHCGISDPQGRIDHARTLDRLARIANSYAAAGADLIAPSDMMDGRVAAIRAALDSAGFDSAGICSYSAKFGSAFYGPFRDAADSAPRSGDRKAYQLDPGNRAQALRAVARDIAEGADIVMVKPAGLALDIVAAVKLTSPVPVAAYQVSGEYAAINAAAGSGWMDARAATLESLTAIARAGADIIVSYAALDAARWLQEA
ncbi:MAG: porphobilinogen synthase [Actinomycetota bacterium]